MAIAAGTTAASVLVLLSGWLPYAAVMGGFIPGRFAGLVMPEELGTAVPAMLTPLSATLIHGGIGHLLLNLLMLVYCGLSTERVVGAAGAPGSTGTPGEVEVSVPESELLTNIKRAIARGAPAAPSSASPASA